MISGEFLITVREVDSGIFAYRLDEANRTGNFDLKLAASYGLLPGKEFTVLKSGGSVLTEAGVIVTPEMVLSKDRPGRCITILGGTPISHAALSPSIQNADCLITPVENDVFIGDGWRPQAMAEFAEASGVKNLILSRTRPSDREWLASEMATLVSGELTVAVAFDLYTHVMPSVKHRT